MILGIGKRFLPILSFCIIKKSKKLKKKQKNSVLGVSFLTFFCEKYRSNNYSM